MVRINSMAEVSTEYFQWLCDLIHADMPNKSYHLLAKALHRREFYWTVPNDDNRAADGQALRDQFADEEDYASYDEIEGPCTMFEMLIALAIRCKYAMDEPEDVNMTVKWFWEICENCELDKFTDEDYYDLGGTLMVNSIIDRILERTFKRNGQGGLFPLKRTKKDQRKIEIWYQANEYLLENYYS